MLVMIPAAWMVLTHAIMLPFGNGPSTFFSQVTSGIIREFHDVRHRVTHLDRILMLDSSLLVQVNNVKATHLFQTLFHLSDDDPHGWRRHSVAILAIRKPTFTPCIYGPSSIEDSITKQLADMSISTADEDPSAFMTFRNQSINRHSVIFDTGASLAITPDRADFDGSLTLPKGDLRLGGMANGLKIEGMGLVTWTFSNGAEDDVVVRGLAYYVPKAKARLLSPQRLFDASTGLQGR